MRYTRRSGLTLVELLIVMVILIALGGLLLPMISGTTQDAKATATQANLQSLATTIARYRTDNNGQVPFPGPLGVSQGRPPVPQLRYLFVNPGTAVTDPTSETAAPSYNPFSKLGWNGPYVLGGIGTYPNPSTPQVAAQGFTTEFGNSGDPCVMDGWLNPIVLVRFTDASGITHAWLQSAGPNGVLAVSYTATGVLTVAGAAVIAPPAPVTPTTATPANPPPPAGGSVFTTSSGTVAVDDMTYVVQ
jgi:type II secretory pathway pseudopilin PulG